MEVSVCNERKSENLPLVKPSMDCAPLLPPVHSAPLCCLLDPAVSLKGLGRALIPELAVDQQPVMTATTTSCNLDTESTAL